MEKKKESQAFQIPPCCHPKNYHWVCLDYCCQCHFHFRPQCYLCCLYYLRCYHLRDCSRWSHQFQKQFPLLKANRDRQGWDEIHYWGCCFSVLHEARSMQWFFHFPPRCRRRRDVNSNLISPLTLLLALLLVLLFLCRHFLYFQFVFANVLIWTVCWLLVNHQAKSFAMKLEYSITSELCKQIMSP